MSEWHVTPDYIVNNWTDELFDLMVKKLVERKEQERDAMQASSRPIATSDGSGLDRMGSMVKVIRKDGD